MEQALILHGSFGSPYENWFEWLNSALQQRGVTCAVPWMPTPAGQTFENWARILDAYSAIGYLAPSATLVTHSSAGAFALKYLARRELKIHRLVTVAGFNRFFSGDADFDAINAELFVSDDELRVARARVADVTCFYSSSDPYLPSSILESFCRSLEGNGIELPQGGHFNTTSGFRDFPQLLEHLTQSR
jgi:uncharacterized protein